MRAPLSTDWPKVPCAMRVSARTTDASSTCKVGCHRLVYHLVLDFGTSFFRLAGLVEVRRIFGLLLAS
jgi:hypothetical protein